jgi:hypothetical protein
MFRWALRRWLDRFERDWNYDAGYPTAKYALGHGKACMRIVVGGTPVMFDHGRVPVPADVAVRTA